MAFRFNQGDRPLSGYTIQRGVGRGGFGEVYYATSDGGKEVALKYLRDNPQVELRGVMHCLNLKSPYLVAIHDVRESAEGEFFVVMEYVNGPSLRDLMNNEAGGLGPQKAAYFLREIGKGLAYLHDRGIVHRDLKLGNIFYEDGYVKIGDYGLAKIMAASQHSGQTMSVGTVHYMAPEVGSGNYDRTIDIYALGVMLYEMLLGKVPFSGATMGEVLMKHLTAQPAVDELPAPFPQVIRKALAKDPNDRYQTVQEMMAEVFAIGNVHQMVDSIDSLSLTRMAAAVAQKMKNVPVAAGGVAMGSSNVTAFSPSPIGPVPPPVVRLDREAGVRVEPGTGPRDAARKGREDKFFGFNDAATFPQRYRVTTGLLGLFLGPLGIHRFYTGFNRWGFVQILVSFVTGGIGGIWGIVEGVQILLNGNFRDSLGRPLLEYERSSQSDSRNVLARVIWGFVAFAMGAGAIATLCAGTFVPPEMASSGLDVDGETFFWNSMHGLYYVAGSLGAAGLFALWKASHRGGLTMWQATVRPALMCGMFALMCAALNTLFNLAAGELQLVFMGLAAGTAVAITVLWLLRGPSMPVLAGDAYWNRAWAKLSLVVFILSCVGSVQGFSRWSKDHYRLEASGPKFKSYTTNTSSFAAVEDVSSTWNDVTGSDADESEDASNDSAQVTVRRETKKIAREARKAADDVRRAAMGGRKSRSGRADGEQKYTVAAMQYSLWPLSSLLMACLAIGSLSETRYRKCIARQALEQLKDQAA